MKVYPHPAKVAVGCYADSVDLEVTGCSKDAAGVLAGLERYTAAGRREPAFAVLFAVGYDGFAFPAEQCRALWARNTVPLVILMPGWNSQIDPRHTLEGIVAGRADREINRFAEAALAAGARDNPLLIAVGTEVNNAGNLDPVGDGWPWCYDAPDAGEIVVLEELGRQPWPKGPALYVRMQRRWVDLFRRRAGDIASWLLWGCLNAPEFPQWNEFRWYGPGADYYDWITLSLHHSLGDFYAVLEEGFGELAGLAGAADKHFMVELAADNNPGPTGDTKQLYLQKGLYATGWDPSLSGNRVRAVTYWNDSEWFPPLRVDSIPTAGDVPGSGDTWEWMLRHANFTGRLSHYRPPAA